MISNVIEELLEIMNKAAEWDREEMEILCRRVENSYASVLKRQVLSGKIDIGSAEESLARLKSLRIETFGGE